LSSEQPSGAKSLDNLHIAGVEKVCVLRKLALAVNLQLEAI